MPLNADEAATRGEATGPWLAEHVSGLLAFFVSFVIVAATWTGHHPPAVPRRRAAVAASHLAQHRLGAEHRVPPAPVRDDLPATHRSLGPGALRRHPPGQPAHAHAGSRGSPRPSARGGARRVAIRPECARGRPSGLSL